MQLQPANTDEERANRLQLLIRQFHQTVACGPTYVCSSCDQLLYRHSVKKQSVCELNSHLLFMMFY
jgi:hypothetical protein